jgi:branched-chain amino acid transport system ATP-binding protein
MSEAVALETARLTVAYGAFRAVDSVTVRFLAGKKYGLIGPNGAGKTTFLNALSGRQAPTDGSIKLGGRDITKLKAYLRLREGIGRSFQIVNVFDELSVRENMLLAVQGAQLGSRQPWFRSRKVELQLSAAVDQLLDQTGLAGLSRMQASTLSHGDQRALEVALSIASEPKVLLLDEPLAGVGHSRIDDTMQVIRRASVGRTVVMVEHNLDAVMDFADEVLVFVGGKLLVQGTPHSIRNNVEVRKAYLGE